MHASRFSIHHHPLPVQSWLFCSVRLRFPNHQAEMETNEVFADLAAIEHLTRINTLPKEVCVYLWSRFISASRELPF